MMKRGCRVALVVSPSGEPFVGAVLRRFDPAVTVTAVPAEPAAWQQTLGRVATEVHADGVVLPLAVDDYPGARQSWGETVVFSPTVGLRDDEVSARWGQVAVLAG